MVRQRSTGKLASELHFLGTGLKLFAQRNQAQSPLVEFDPKLSKTHGEESFQAQ